VIAGDSCSSCGVHLAADQRYCVECGQSRGAPRLPPFPGSAGSLDAQAPPADPPPAGSRSGRPATWGPLNVTVIAVIGALFLAMAVGVLIGRSDQTGSAGSRVTTLVLSGTGAPLAATGPTVAAAPAVTGATGSAGTTAAAATTKAATKTTPATTPPPKVVKVGSSGTGPGYQKGKFTGNFFGGG
jgi:hypothetical protein